MKRALETTRAEVERALLCARPGWFETSMAIDAMAAHDLLAIVRMFARANPERLNGMDDACLDAAAPWLED